MPAARIEPVAVITTVGSRYVDRSKRKGLHLQQIADEVIE